MSASGSTVLHRWAETAARWLRTPLAKLLILALLLRLPGLFWGLPASDGWDEDGVGPRDFLAGVVESYWPGHHYTYPPFHLLLLSGVSAPVWAVALLHAPSLNPQTVISTFIQVPIMTALAVLARAVTIALSLGLVWNVSKIGQALGGAKAAGLWVAAVCVVNVPFLYYSQTTNLDVPYLFWGVLALRLLVEATVYCSPKKLFAVPIVAALAVATKDQALALFLLTVPLTLALWFAIDPRARADRRAIFREFAFGVGVAIFLLLLLDGAITNPHGFADRVRFLLGPASQDYAYYANTFDGRMHVLLDSLTRFADFYPWVFAPLVFVGIWSVLAKRQAAWGLDAREASTRVAGLVPLFAAISFTIAFDMSARRTEQRFVLPQMLMWGIYIGLALNFLYERLEQPSVARDNKVTANVQIPGVRRSNQALATGGLIERRSMKGMVALASRRWILWAAVLPTFAVALFHCAAVDAAIVLDPKYDAERWMQANVKAGDRIEVYDSNVHLPRFPSQASVGRVSTTPLSTRNPLPNVSEVQDCLSNVEERRPRFIVFSDFLAWRYLTPLTWVESNGHVASTDYARMTEDKDSRSYLQALVDGRLKYRRVHVSRFESAIWPRVDIHGSLEREVWIFERVAN